MTVIIQVRRLPITASRLCLAGLVTGFVALAAGEDGSRRESRAGKDRRVDHAASGGHIAPAGVDNKAQQRHTTDGGSEHPHSIDSGRMQGEPLVSSLLSESLSSRSAEGKAKDTLERTSICLRSSIATWLVAAKRRTPAA